MVGGRIVMAWDLSSVEYSVATRPVACATTCPRGLFAAASGLKALLGRWQIVAVVLAAALVLADGVVSFRVLSKVGSRPGNI